MKYFIPLFFCFLMSSILTQAQIIEYNFEDNLVDEVQSLDAIYIINGQESNESPTYLSFGESKGILLEPKDGLKFPSSVNDQIDFDKSLEIEFSFKITDIGTADGNMNVLTMRTGNWLTDAGITIFAYAGEEEINLVFDYSDGLYDFVPNHDAHSENYVGSVKLNEIINLSLIIDFDKVEWTTLVNGKRTSASFDTPAYDFEKLKEGMRDNTIYVGWTDNINGEPDVIFPTGLVNSIKLYSPRKPGNIQTLSNAIDAFTDHVTNTNSLTLQERQDFLASIYDNFNGNYENVKDKIFEFTSAYETNNPPLFESRNFEVVANLDPTALALIYFQQDIHKNQFVDGNIENMEGIKFEGAEVFPGRVSEEAPRVNNATIEINATTFNPSGYYGGANIDGRIRPIGYYAPPGEIVSIIIPATLVDEGFRVLIGAHTADQSSYGEINRFLNVTKTFSLDSDTTLIANPFGGGLYILVPNEVDFGWINFGVSGAVKSPYFSSRTGRMTPISEWQAELANEHVAWVDIESDHYMMTLPLVYGSDFPDPTELMDYWDEIMEGYTYLAGRPLDEIVSGYFTIETRIGGGFFPGYPQMMPGRVVPYGEQLQYEYYPSNVLTEDFHKSPLFIFFHEMGHAITFPTLQEETESNVNLPAVYVYNEIFDIPLDEALTWSLNEVPGFDGAAMDWMIADNFRNNKVMGCDPTMEIACSEKGYQTRGHAKYADMAKIFGWESFHEMNKYFYEKWVIDDSYEVTDDRMIRAASEGSGVNMAPLFHFWGVQPTPALAIELSELPISEEIKDRLNYYKSIIPDNETEFQSWYDQLRNKKDPVHYGRYDYALENFDNDNYASDMKAQIDFIIDLYFNNTTVNTEEDQNTPIKFALEQNYPNPFNPETQIQFSLPESELVSLEVYDVLGKKVASLISNKKLNVGKHSYNFNASNLASGVYIYKLKSSSFLKSRKMMIIK